MKHVAFFRNTNLGRPRSPSRVQLEDAFLRAGAASAHSFLTNGTLVFEAANTPPALLAMQARERLHEACGLVEPVFIRSFAQLKRLVASDPFGSMALDDVYECCVTFLQVGAGRRLEAPQRNPRGDVEIVARQGDASLSLSRKFGASPGSPNAYLERLLGQQATTRSWSTIQRLVSKYA